MVSEKVITVFNCVHLSFITVLSVIAFINTLQTVISPYMCRFFVYQYDAGYVSSEIPCVSL